MSKFRKNITQLIILSLVLLMCTSCNSNITTNIPLPQENGDNVQIETPTSTTTMPSTSKPSSSFVNDLKIHFIDVGQADSILIVLSNSQNMLIDAGNNADGSSVVSYIKSQGISKLDYVIGTHPHEDHIGGMDDIIKAFEIDKIIMPKVSNTTKTFENVLTAISSKGLKVTSPIPGTSYSLGDVNFTILAPNSSGYEDLNNNSVVVKLTYGKTSFLLAGDAEDVSEFEILGKGFDLKSDVLKVGHHGSTSSTTQSFLNAVKPTYAVISVGSGNSYGHPAASTISKLSSAGVKVFRTDESSTIIATSDGNTIKFDKKATPIKQQAPPAVSNSNNVISSNHGSEPTTEQYIGNKSSKKFHMPSCSSLPADKNRVFFDTRGSALNGGYIPCKRCNP